MKRFSVLAIATAAAFLAAWGLLSAGAAERVEGTVRGKFIRLIERQVGEKEYLGAVLAPLEGKDEVVVLFPRKSDQAAVARRLAKGQQVAVRYVVEAGHKWAKRIEPIPHEGEPRPEGERKREGQGQSPPAMERLARQVRQLAQRVEKLEQQVKQLRAENERLRKAVGLKGESGEADRPAHEDRPSGEKESHHPELAPGLPEGLHGFRGMLGGTVAAKGDRSFVLKVEKVLKTWPQNKARHPGAAIGHKLKLVIGADGRLAERHMAVFKKLQVGDRVVVEAFHTEGNVLKVVEELRKAE